MSKWFTESTTKTEGNSVLGKNERTPIYNKVLEDKARAEKASKEKKDAEAKKKKAEGSK